MMTQKVLYTCAGGLDLVYLPEFINRINLEQLQNQIEYVITERLTSPIGQAFFPTAVDLPRLEEASKKDKNALKVFHVADMQHLTSEVYIWEQARLAAKLYMAEQFKILVAKKKPDFFIKDLTIEEINNLASKYAQNFGDSKCCGLEVSLSPYQKFFVIVSPETFKFYVSISQDPFKIAVEFKGSLVDFKPDTWVMGRYENLEYLKELSSYSVRMA